MGSVLVGSVSAIAEARIWRKRYGGGMRQVGILAAAGLYALEHHVERLADDHARARRAAAAFAEAAPGCVDPTTVETNILVVDVSVAGWRSTDLVAAALEQGVRFYAVGPRAVRLVWHLDVDDAATDHAVDVVTGLLRRCASRSCSEPHRNPDPRRTNRSGQRPEDEAGAQLRGEERRLRGHQDALAGGALDLGDAHRADQHGGGGDTGVDGGEDLGRCRAGR